MRAFLLLLCALSAPRARAEPRPPAPPLAELRLEGLSGLAPKDLRNIIPLKAGAPLDPLQAGLAQETALSFYRSKGYLEAAASTAALSSPQGPVLVISFREGPLYRFGRTEVSGQQRLSTGVILGELAYQKGDPYERSKLLKTQANLYALGLIEDLSITVSTTASHEADVRIAVRREAPLKWVKGGVGYGSLEKERLTLGLTHNNFLGRGYRAELSGSASSIWLDYKADFLNRHFLGTQVQQGALVDWHHEVQPGYKFETTLGQVSLVRQVGAALKLSPYYQFNRTIVFGLDPSISTTTPALVHESKVGFTLSWDDSFEEGAPLEERFFPRRGERLSLTLEHAGGALGAGTDFNKLTVNAVAYRELLGPLVGVLTARAGGVAEYGGFAEVPIQDRFFTGGANSIRGYLERGVGPTDGEGNAVGGDTLAGANAELRFPLYKRLSGAAFLDGGQVGRRAEDVFPKRWVFGAGAGLRVATPVGPIRLDLGFKLKPALGTDTYRLHLSIGEAF